MIFSPISMSSNMLGRCQRCGRGNPERFSPLHTPKFTSLAPSNSKLDFDAVVRFDAGDDWSEGDMAGAWVEFHPLDHPRDLRAKKGIQN